MEEMGKGEKLTRDKEKQELSKLWTEQLPWKCLLAARVRPLRSLAAWPRPRRLPTAAASLADASPSAVPHPDGETRGLAFSFVLAPRQDPSWILVFTI